MWCWVPGRIIPARAGFTWSHRTLRASCRDHPRSRGVYNIGQKMDVRTRGSSPLARGLLALLGVLGEVARIIPARAGFTLPDDRDHPSSADHPRSRGVYRRGAPDGGRDAGSSPLARGLRLGTCASATASRIIPARAGFTMSAYVLVPSREDHPRSRGVYSSRP